MELFLFDLIHKLVRLTTLLKTASAEAFHEAFLEPTAENMDGYVRLELFIIGCVFLAVPMTMDTSLHWILLLPLMSIYLIQAAISGYEPLYATIKHFAQSANHHWTHNKPVSQH